ncbi:MAG TPA: hypothetical protein VIF82_18290 [Burkholderiaceae bacterium]|jgi:hypothetical protein
MRNRDDSPGKDNRLRLNVSVARDEHPDLFDELKKFSSGHKRVQRIKTLASERLLLAGRILSAPISVRQDAAQASDIPQVQEDELAAAHELCLPPIK